MEMYPIRAAANESEVSLMENLYLLCKSIYELEVELDFAIDEAQSFGDINEDPRWDAQNAKWDTLHHMEERAAELREEAAALPALEALPWQLFVDIQELLVRNPHTSRYEPLMTVALRINSVLTNPNKVVKAPHSPHYLGRWLELCGFNRDTNGFCPLRGGCVEAKLLFDYITLMGR